MNHYPKLIFHSMDAVFRVVEINPDLPDPDTFDKREHRRIVPKEHRPVSFGGYTTSSSAPCESVYREEAYIKDYLYDNYTGRRIAYWRRTV